MIAVKHLTKRYGEHVAVEDLSFTVEQGCIYGLLGPNGAGKSTTMNIITGYIAATDGTVEIDGLDIFEQPAEARAKIGYLPEQPPLYPDMTPREYLDFAAELKGYHRADRAQLVETAMEATGVVDVQNRLIRNLSKGYRQRVGLAGAILGDPEVIILDEPTVGLDPKQIIEIRGLIRSLGQKHTVVLSSHILSEVSAVCDKVLIISHGKLVACDTPEALMQMTQSETVLELTVLGSEADARAALSGVEQVRSIETMPAQEADAVCLHVSYDSAADLRAAVSRALADAGLTVLSLHAESRTLEDVFLSLTQDDTQPDAAETDAQNSADLSALVQPEETPRETEEPPAQETEPDAQAVQDKEDTHAGDL